MAAARLLAALGQPVESDGMTETPRRMVHAYADMLTSGSFDFTTFANAEDHDELVLVEDIPVRSVCEHHLLPFAGVAHVGYFPADPILGLQGSLSGHHASLVAAARGAGAASLASASAPTSRPKSRRATS